MNIFEQEERDAIAGLEKWVGRKVPDNFSPNYQSVITAYNGDGTFTLTNPQEERIVKWTTLDLMIYGK